VCWDQSSNLEGRARKLERKQSLSKKRQQMEDGVPKGGPLARLNSLVFHHHKVAQDERDK
jgi:hypothetical protein